MIDSRRESGRDGKVKDSEGVGRNVGSAPLPTS